VIRLPDLVPGQTYPWVEVARYTARQRGQGEGDRTDDYDRATREYPQVARSWGELIRVRGIADELDLRKRDDATKVEMLLARLKLAPPT
jgi:hypothetical protein